MGRYLILWLMTTIVAGCTGLDHPEPPPLPPGQNHPEPETIDLSTAVHEVE